MKRKKSLSHKVDYVRKKQCMLTGKSLPDDLTIDILSRLPVKQLMRFKCVSKTWIQLLTVDPQFLRLHHQRSSSRNPGIILHYTDFVRDHSIEFHYAEDYTECDKPIRLNLPFTISPQYNISGICNGLLLLTREYDSEQRRSPDRFDLYIWNPLTVEHISFPSLKISSLKNLHVSCMTFLGFGFDQATDDYKVVRLAVISKSQGFRTQVSVYSLRKASWRSLEDDIPYRISYNGTNSRTMVNGAFHWLAHKLNRDCIILSFDINTETIREMPFPVPVVLGREHNMWLWELGGLLASSQYRSDGELDLWVMKEYGVSDSWTKHISIEKHQVGFSYLQPVGVVNNGDIIFKNESSTSNKLILYHPKTNAIEELKCVLAKKSVLDKWMYCAISAYKESLVSPKSLPYY